MKRKTPRAELRTAPREELASVHGAGRFWSSVKSVGRWIKDHVTSGPGDKGKGVGIKGTHDIGGG